VKFSPNGRYLASGGVEGELVVWDVFSGSPLLFLTNSFSSPTSDLQWGTVESEEGGKCKLGVNYDMIFSSFPLSIPGEGGSAISPISDYSIPLISPKQEWTSPRRSPRKKKQTATMEEEEEKSTLDDDISNESEITSPNKQMKKKRKFIQKSSLLDLESEEKSSIKNDQKQQKQEDDDEDDDLFDDDEGEPEEEEGGEKKEMVDGVEHVRADIMGTYLRDEEDEEDESQDDPIDGVPGVMIDENGVNSSSNLGGLSIDKLNQTLSSSFQFHPPFQPSSSSLLLMNENEGGTDMKSRFLCWNDIGVIISRNEDTYKFFFFI